MKATGIVRRIDDLVRVVIPKKIHRTMRIRDGDPSKMLTLSDLYIALHNIIDRYKNPLQNFLAEGLFVLRL